MPYYILKRYLLLKLASHLDRTRTTMEISSTPIALCVILGIVIMCNTIILYTTGMRLGFGINSGKVYVAIDSNLIQHCRF